ncbi:MAG: ABC transporter permease [Ardenticatenaceae bacterium]|nr:ABC transporter permease [Anaerolineales bacterium]MCB8938633.1 ABC transporter permease [Ardenticatenaceae bacterium]MCB8973766.1 ABC transporter permease [Ardenticatenaceae bacterium]
MVLKYVLKNFRRRKVRTLLMVLSLLVSTGLIVAMSATVETVRQSNVELIASGVGRYDLTVAKTDISSEPFVEVDRVSQTILTADPSITAVYPRIQSIVEMAGNGEQANGWLIALDASRDDVGFIDVVEGEYELGDDGAAVLEATANTFGLKIGDSIDVSYSYPQPREEGKPETVGSSQQRTTARFTVNAIVRQDGVADAGVRDGLIIDLADAQSWLGLQGRADRVIGLVDSRLYQSRDSEAAALSVRDVAANVQAALGEEYQYSLDKAVILDASAQAFLILQALINTYGLMALGVVGLLVHTLVMTNVQEQKREMAILRILGSQQRYLFILVIGEVAVIGAIGIGLGVILGQLITTYGVVPFITFQMSQSGLVARLQPAVSLTAVLPAIISAIVVLFLSALKPARDAANTKVMHAINPGVADNLQLEDLAGLRERKPSGRMFLIGLFLMFVVTMTVGLDVVSSLGNPAAEATIILAAVLMMVVGVGFLFFITTVPFERLILFLTGLAMPRLTYFAKRNVGRNQGRNTLISLLVLFSGVLPSFLATQSAIANKNLESDVRLDAGAPVEVAVFGGFGPSSGDASLNRLKPSFIDDELLAIPGMDQAVGLTYGYRTSISDPVGMRSGSISLVGVDGRLNDVLFGEMIEFVGGGPDSLDQILADDSAIVISQGLAEGLAVPLGGIVKITGAGLDHVEELRVVGIARTMPGFRSINRVRTQGLGGSDVFISMNAFRRITNDPLLPLPSADEPIIDRILGTTLPDADPFAVSSEMTNRFSLKYSIFTQIVEVRLEQAQASRAQEQAFLLVLTVISFTTAVFGVFAVIYVTIYARRLEIGMMKAIGTRTRELTGMLIVESIAMTLSAALAGITAGAAMGYLFAYFDSISAQRPLQLAVDTTVMPFVVIMVVLASIIGATFSARRIVKKRAVEILRM